MVTKLELEDYKVFSYNTEVEFEFDLNLLIQNKLPSQIQDLLNEISGLNRMLLSGEDRYVVATTYLSSPDKSILLRPLISFNKS